MTMLYFPITVNRPEIPLSQSVVRARTDSQLAQVILYLVADRTEEPDFVFSQGTFRLCGTDPTPERGRQRTESNREIRLSSLIK